MSPHQPPRTREIRGRILVIGSDPAARVFASNLRRHFASVSEIASIFDALAEVGEARAREPILAVLVSSTEPALDLGEVFDVFNSLDPAPLVLLYPEGEDDLSAAAIGAGFENALPFSSDDGEIVSLLRDIGAIEAVRPPGTSGEHSLEKQHHASAPPASIPAPKDIVEISIAKAMAHVHPEAPQASATHTQSAPATHATASTPYAAPNTKSNTSPTGQPRRAPFTMPSTSKVAPAKLHEGPPNDLSLVRAVIDGDDLRAAALRALQHQLGTTDVRLVAPARAGEEEAVARERHGLRQVPVVGQHGNFGVLLSATVDLASLNNWATWLAEWIDLDESHRQLRRLVWSDELTNAGNRRAFFELLPSTLQSARENRRNVSLMYLDIDDFKKYNDLFGHAAGDEVLRETVEVLRSSIRPGDHVFRMGGDEFVILFCDPNPPRQGGGGVPEDVRIVAQRCRDSVRKLALPLLGTTGPGTVTMSAGFALYPWEASSGEDLLALADQRALAAKGKGKDTIVFGPEPPPPEHS